MEKNDRIDRRGVDMTPKARRPRALFGRAQRLFRLALLALAGAAALLQTTALDATADGEPYSVSLHSPVTFPVDI